MVVETILLHVKAMFTSQRATEAALLLIVTLGQAVSPCTRTIAVSSSSVELQLKARSLRWLRRANARYGPSRGAIAGVFVIEALPFRIFRRYFAQLLDALAL